MKKLILFLVSVIIFQITNAQHKQVPSTASAPIHYDSLTLTQKGKVDLTTIYLQKTETFFHVLPYAVFPIKGQVSGINNIDIPASSYTARKREALAKSSAKMNEDTKKNMTELIPYADKADIIKAILFIQTMSEKLDSGL